MLTSLIPWQGKSVLFKEMALAPASSRPLATNATEPFFLLVGRHPYKKIMPKLDSKLMVGAALSAVLLAGCGGGGAPPVMEQTISQLIANSDPIDINGLTLASDDNSDPTLVN